MTLGSQLDSRTYTTIPDGLIKILDLKNNLVRAARTLAPTATNYDVGSTYEVDLRLAPLPSAMEVTGLGHGPS